MKILLSLDTYDVTPSAHLFITFLRIIARGTAISMLVVVLMNYLIDPYSIYSAPRLDGINSNKPLLFKYLRLTKAHAIMRKQPDALILGSSRTEHGLDPEHPALINKYNSFNLALTGASIYENLRYLQHANAVNPLKKVVLAVDFFQFNAPDILFVIQYVQFIEPAGVLPPRLVPQSESSVTYSHAAVSSGLDFNLWSSLARSRRVNRHSNGRATFW